MDFLYTLKGKIIAGVVAAGVIAGVVVVTLMLAGGSKGTTATHSNVPKGYTDVVTVPTYAPNVPKPAQARPSVAPPKIYATGACATALDGVRAVMNQYPSGLALDDAGNKKLTEAIAAVNKSCDVKLATAFQQQELMPWLNYAVPAKK